MALRTDFARTVAIPENMIANDQFLYFTCITRGRSFIYQRSAIAWYRSPSTLKDHIRQNSRFIASHGVMKKIFGDVANMEYTVSKSLLYKVLFLESIKRPIHAAVIFCINKYCQYKALRERGGYHALWDMALSTKDGIIGK